MSPDIPSFNDFPHPPSVNGLYASPKHIANYKGKHRRFKSKIYRTFESDVALWHLNNRQLVCTVQALAQPFIDQNKFYLELSANFLMPIPDVFDKKGRVKKNDASNRLKALHDSISNLIGIDDKFFCVGPSRFVPAPIASKKVTVLFRLVPIETMSQVTEA